MDHPRASASSRPPRTSALADERARSHRLCCTHPLTAAGQVFRMAMYHAGHPDGNYQMANRVQVFDPPQAISWEPGQDTGDGSLRFGGWVWRYDLAPAGPSGTRVTLSY